jgi:hypothetical protein
MGGDRAGRAIAGKRDPMKQVGSARAVATSKARIRVAQHEASVRIAAYKANRRQRIGSPAVTPARRLPDFGVDRGKRYRPRVIRSISTV